MLPFKKFLDFMEKVKIIDEPCVKTIVEMQCMACDSIYEKETWILQSKLADLPSTKRLGMCNDCLLKLQLNDEETMKRLNKNLEQLKNQMEKDGDNEITLI